MNGESIRLPPADGELARLVESMIDGTIAPEERDRLESLLADNPDAQLFYVASLDLHAQVQWLMRDGTTAEGRVAESGPGDRLSDERRSERSEESGVHYSPGSELETLARSASEGEPVPVPRLRFGLVPSPSAAWGLGWLSNGVLLSYAICALLVGFGVLAAWSWNSPAFGPRAAKNIFRAPVASPAGIGPPIVATISRSVGCDWEDPSFGRVGTGIPLGSCYCLASGRLEITYNIGAKVLIEGPAMFAVDAPDGGFLQLGHVLVQVAPGRRDARAKRWEAFYKGARKRSTIGPGVPDELGDKPIFCVRFGQDSAHCHTVMSDRGAEFALSRDTDGSLVGYIVKSPVWVSTSEFEFSTPRFLPEGASVLAGVDKDGASRLAVEHDKPPAASLHGLLEGKSFDMGGNRGQRGS